MVIFFLKIDKKLLIEFIILSIEVDQNYFGIKFKHYEYKISLHHKIYVDIVLDRFEILPYNPSTILWMEEQNFGMILAEN